MAAFVTTAAMEFCATIARLLRCRSDQITRKSARVDVTGKRRSKTLQWLVVIASAVALWGGEVAILIILLLLARRRRWLAGCFLFLARKHNFFAGSTHVAWSLARGVALRGHGIALRERSSHRI
jgi:hypothetical protein